MSSSNKTKARGLGRGLSALLADVDEQNAGESVNRAGVTQLPIEQIVPNKNQPRRDFDPVALDELANSIRAQGVVQPLIVRALGNQYQIVAGERRWRAAQMAQLHELPVIIRDYDDGEVATIALIENIQRENLNPIEEAQAYADLMRAFDQTQERLAQSLGKSRSHVANMMRLLNLPAEVLTMVRQGRLSMGHARALLAAEDPRALAQKVVDQGLSVRALENAIKSPKKPREKFERLPNDLSNADIRALEHELSAATKLKVSIKHGANEAGTVTIAYRDIVEFDEIVKRLGK